MRYRIFSSCVMHKKNYVHLILQIQSKANDVIKIAWTLSGFNFSAIGSLWRSLEAVLQPRHSDSVASLAKPRPLEAFKGQRWLKNWNNLKFSLFWSQYYFYTEFEGWGEHYEKQCWKFNIEYFTIFNTIPTKSTIYQISYGI